MPLHALVQFMVIFLLYESLTRRGAGEEAALGGAGGVSLASSIKNKLHNEILSLATAS